MRDAEYVRKHIDNLLLEKGISYAQASRGIGKGVAYIHQYINKRSPVRLPETQRKRLSIILDVPEEELTDINVFKISSSSINSNSSNTISIDIIDTVACCGGGLEVFGENTIGQWIMPSIDYKDIAHTAPDNIKMLRVKGDSMEPTLKDGDWVLVDIAKLMPDSDGMFLLQLSTGLSVKRLQGTISNEILVKSDNPKYQAITAEIGEIKILGKVIYTLNAEKVG